MTDVERAVLETVSLEAPWALVERFATTPRWRPNDVNAAADHIVERARALGLPVEVHAPTLYLSVPLDASVEVNGERHRAKPPSHSPSVPDGLTAPVVYLPANTKALRSYARDVKELFGDAVQDLDDVKAKVEGRIFLTEGFGNPALTSLVEEWGGVGLIAMNPGVDIHWGTCTTIWGTPDLDDLPRKPKIPVVAVNRDAGAVLKELAAGDGEATIRTEMQEGWFTQKIPVVEIPGNDEPESFVFVHGHYDSWDVGVGDNATGDATLLELARVLWQHRKRLRRSVRVAWWPGHSTGRYAGSTWYADAFAIDLDENCVAQVNCDSPGCRWATSYHQTTAMSETTDFVARAIRDVVPNAHVRTKRPNQAGDYAFNNIGITSYFMLSSTMPDELRAEKGYYDVSGCGGNIAWHTENDQLEIADKGVLQTDIKIYTLCAYRNATAEVLPYDFRATLKEFAEHVARYQQAAGDAFDLTPARHATDNLAAALDSFYGEIATGNVRPAAANAVQRALARVLVPINFTREPRFRHDPAYTCPPLPTLATAGELDRYDADTVGFAKTQLMRGQNRYVAALREAERIVERALR